MDNNNVKIVGIDIPFIDLVNFLIKLALAAVPAILTLAILNFGFNSIFGRLLA